MCLLCSHVQGEVTSVVPCTHHLGASLVQQQVNTVLQEGHRGGGQGTSADDAQSGLLEKTMRGEDVCINAKEGGDIRTACRERHGVDV